MLARIAVARSPCEMTTDLPVTMSAAIARNGIGSSSKFFDCTRSLVAVCRKN